MYLHYFVFAFVVRLSKWLFCDIWSQHYLLIVTIVYHVSSIQVSVHYVYNYFEPTYYLKMKNDLSTCLHTYL